MMIEIKLSFSDISRAQTLLHDPVQDSTHTNASMDNFVAIPLSEVVS